MFFGFLYAYEHYERFMHVNILLVYFWTYIYITLQVALKKHQANLTPHNPVCQIVPCYKNIAELLTYSSILKYFYISWNIQYLDTFKNLDLSMSYKD